jgi:hypothetical protein
MVEQKPEYSANRRDAMKAMSTAGVTVLGLGTTSGIASAGDDDPQFGTQDNTGSGGGSGGLYKVYDTRTEGHGIQQRSSAGIDIVQQDSPSGDANYWTYDINVAGRGYVADGNGDLADRVMRKQGIFVREKNPNYSAVLYSKDKRLRGLKPAPDNFEEGTFGAATTALSLASSALNASEIGYLLGASQLAVKLADMAIQDSQNNAVHDWQQIDSAGFKRGSHHMGFSVREYPGSPISLEVYSRWGGIVHGWELNFNNGFRSIRTLDADLSDVY